MGEHPHRKLARHIVYSRCVDGWPHPTTPRTLYAPSPWALNFGAEFVPSRRGLMRSTDLGETWERFDHGAVAQDVHGLWRGRP